MDMQFNLGQVAVTAAVSLVGYGLRQIYGLVNRFLQRMDSLDNQVGENAAITDTHTESLEKAGLLLGKPHYTRRASDRWRD